MRKKFGKDSEFGSYIFDMASIAAAAAATLGNVVFTYGTQNQTAKIVIFGPSFFFRICGKIRDTKECHLLNKSSNYLDKISLNLLLICQKSGSSGFTCRVTN